MTEAVGTPPLTILAGKRFPALLDAEAAADVFYGVCYIK